MYALFSKQCHAYAQWVNTNLLVPAFREGVDVILTAGGGWMFVETLIMQANPKRTILAPHMFSHIKHVPVYNMNAYGNLVLLAQNIRAHG